MLALLLLYAVLTFVYADTVSYLIGIWNDIKVGEYAHGYMVILISAWLIYRKQALLRSARPFASWKGLLLLSFAGAIWLAASVMDIQVLMAFSLWLMLIATLWALLGTNFFKELIFPLSFLLFALPIWFPLSPLLQNITADSVFYFVRLMKIPALRQDYEIILPAGALSIEEACSGLRYFLAALAIGSLYAYINYSRLFPRVIVVITAGLVAILGNLIRVFVIVYLGWSTEMQHPYVQDHLSLGWYIFGILMVLALAFDVILSRFLLQGVSTLEHKPAIFKDRSCSGSLGYFFIVVSAAIIIYLPAAVNGKITSDLVSITDGDVSLLLPPDIGPFSRVPVNSNNWHPEFNGAFAHVFRYQYKDRFLDLFVGYYPRQFQGAELINDLNRVYNKTIWKSNESRPHLYKIGNLTFLEERITSRSTAKPMRVLFWYNVAGYRTTDPYMAKLLQILGAFTGRPEAYLAAVCIDANGWQSEDIQQLARIPPAVEQALDSQNYN